MASAQVTANDHVNTQRTAMQQRKTFETIKLPTYTSLNYDEYCMQLNALSGENRDSGSMLGARLLRSSNFTSEFITIVTDDVRRQGYFYSREYNTLSVRECEVGLHMGKFVTSVLGGSVVGLDKEPHPEILQLLIEKEKLPLLKLRDGKYKNGKLWINADEKDYVDFGDRGKPTSTFDCFSPDVLGKLVNINVPCCRISRLETEDGDIDSLYVLDSFSCGLVKIPIIHKWKNLRPVGEGESMKLTLLGYNPLELKGIWYVGKGNKFYTQRVTNKPLLKDRITSNFIKNFEQHIVASGPNISASVSDPVNWPRSIDIFVFHQDELLTIVPTVIGLDAILDGYRFELVHSPVDPVTGARSIQCERDIDTLIASIAFVRNADYKHFRLERHSNVHCVMKVFYRDELFMTYIEYLGHNVPFSGTFITQGPVYLKYLMHQMRDQIYDEEQRAKGQMIKRILVDQFKTSKVSRYLAHLTIGRNFDDALFLAERSMVPISKNDDDVCPSCGSRSVDIASHIALRCMYTLEQFGLYVCTRVEHAWLVDEMNRQVNRQLLESKYRTGAFGPMLDARGQPLTLSEGLAFIRIHGKFERVAGKGMFFKFNLSYYGVIADQFRTTTKLPRSLTHIQHSKSGLGIESCALSVREGLRIARNNFELSQVSRNITSDHTSQRSMIPVSVENVNQSHANQNRMIPVSVENQTV